MSARSSSGSWSGAGGSPPDIIDLDKFMRGAVRPSRGEGHALRCGNNLVVDAGGVDRTPAAAPSPPAHLAPLPAAPAPALSAPSDSSCSRPRPHGKRYSHDSGLSDTSYARRKHRPHRRAAGDSSGPRAPRSVAAGGGGAGGGAGGSSASLRAFRAVCERALLDQQAQIARVAQLCERLSERAPAPPAPSPAPPPAPRRSERSTDSSDVSSSSRSTRDQRRKDKHRTDECKTYKIIMNKLDELNRLFAARARSPQPAARASPPAPRPAPAPAPAPRHAPPPSSGSVSVSDKLVSTEPDHHDRPRDLARELQVLHNVVTIRGGSTYGACGASAGVCRHTGRTLARAHTLDCAPSDKLPHHVATESVAECDSRAVTGTSGADPRCGFDLDDPVHLYSQAKRLQAMSATTRRARSVEPSTRRCERSGRYAQDVRRSPGAAPRARESACEQPRERSLCSLCRGYWRSLTNYLAAQFFCCPEAASAVR